MGKEYRVKSIFRWLPYLFGACAVIIAVMVSKMLFISLSTPQLTSSQKSAAFFGFIVLVEFSTFTYIFYRIAGVRISLDEDSINFKNRGVTKRIPFDDITRLKGGVFGKIISNTESIQLRNALENIYDLLVEFKEALDNKGLSSLYDEKKVLHQMKMVSYMDQDAIWLRRIFPKLILTALLAAIFGYAFSKIGGYGREYTIVWIVSSALWPFVLYFAFDIGFLRWIARQPSENFFPVSQHYMNIKKKACRRVFFIGAAVYFAFPVGLFVVRLNDHQALWKVDMDEGRALHEEGRFVEAESKFSLALKRAEKMPSEEHAVEYTLIWLGYTYKRQKKYTDAEASLEKAIAISEKNPRPDRWFIATASVNLARVFEDQEKHDKAEELFRQALAIREDHLEPDDTDIAESLDELAKFYEDRQRYSEAEPLYVRALAIREEAHGPDRSDTVRSILGLAGVYHIQEKYSDAEEQYKRAMTIGTKIFKTDDLRFADVLGGMAGLYRKQARYDEAEPLYLQALAIREQKLGSDHACVVSTMEGYAEVLRGMGRDAEAEELEARAESNSAKHAEGGAKE